MAGSEGDRVNSRPTKIPSHDWLQPGVIAHKAGRILEGGENIFASEGGILVQNILDRIARAQKFEDGLDGYASTTDDGTSSANSRVDDDPFVHFLDDTKP